MREKQDSQTELSVHPTRVRMRFVNANTVAIAAIVAMIVIAYLYTR